MLDVQQKIETMEVLLAEREREMATAQEKISSLTEDLIASQGKVGFLPQPKPVPGLQVLVLHDATLMSLRHFLLSKLAVYSGIAKCGLVQPD